MSQDQVDFSPTKATMTLDLVLNSFQQWRTNRVKRGKIPAELMEQACSLVGLYPMTTITKALGLCFSQFRTQCVDRGLIQPKKTKNKKTKASKQAGPQVNFVEVGAAPKPPALSLSGEAIRMVLRRTDGASLEIALPQTGAAAELMARFLKG